MQEKVGRNEQIWRLFSKKLLGIAMAWPVDKQIRFTYHPKFQNLILSDQALLRRAIQEGLPAPDHPPEENPAPSQSSRRPAASQPMSHHGSTVILQVLSEHNSLLSLFGRAAVLAIAAAAAGRPIRKWRLLTTRKES
jgi:hypothetical protein